MNIPSTGDIILLNLRHPITGKPLEAPAKVVSVEPCDLPGARKVLITAETITHVPVRTSFWETAP